MRAYALRVLVSIDQFANTLLDGNPDETISSRAYKASLKGRAWGCVLCGLLDRLSPGHCARSVEWDEA